MAERHVNFEGLQEPGGFAGSGRPPAQVYELYPRDNREAIAAGIRFLSAKREGRHWVEFTEIPGGSDLWITALVIAELSNMPVRSMNPALREELAQSADWMSGLQNDDGGWGFSAGQESDAESTSWTILALRGQGRAVPESATHFLERCRRSDGGIGLYPAERGAGRLSKPENPDVAALMMRALGTGDASAEDFLKTCWLQTNRPLPPARLQSRFHTFAMLLEWESMPPTWPVLEKLCELMSSNRAENAFDQALLLRCLTRLRIQKASSVAAGLRRMQQADGGWPSSASLRLTVSGSEGSGPIYSDDQRILTTAAAVSALAGSANAVTESNHHQIAPRGPMDTSRHARI